MTRRGDEFLSRLVYYVLFLLILLAAIRIYFCLLYTSDAADEL